CSRENHRARRQLQDVYRRCRQTSAGPGAGIAAQHPRRRHRLDRDPRREPGRVPGSRPRRLPDRGVGGLMGEPAAKPRKEAPPAEAGEMLAGGAQLIDVRADHEWEAGHLPGAVHIPLAELPQHLDEIDKDRPVILYCRGGNRSSMATAALAEAGYDASKLLEGAVGWEEEGLP